MGKEKREVSIKAIMEIKQFTSYLQDLMASLKEGKVCVQQGNEFVFLTPGELIEVEVEATQKKDKEKFSLELSWKTDGRGSSEISDLRISSEEPVTNNPVSIKKTEKLKEESKGKTPKKN